MPWYFYNKDSVVVPQSPSILAPGDIILSTAPISLSPPDGFLFCDGTPYLKNDYLDLYAEIVGRFGQNVPTIAYFNVPDMRNIFPRGSISSATLGSSGGQSTHSHTMAVHPHTGVSSGTHSHSVTDTHTHTIAHTHNLSGHSHIGTPVGADPAVQTAMTLGTATQVALNMNYEVVSVDKSAAATHTHTRAGHEVENATDVANNQTATATQVGGSSSAPNTSGIASSGSSADANASTQATSTVANTPPFLALSFLIKT